jgi:PKD repeat protein
MRLIFYPIVLIGLLISSISFAQDFSNKGKEFWLAYSYHVGMSGGGNPTMTIYITSDQNANYTVETFGVGPIQTGTVAAGQVVSVTIPTSLFINDEGTFTNRAIRVTADKPVVVYSYITRSQASAATLCLPTTVLGKEYYSFNFTQISNEPNSNSYFTIVAVEDNTSVEITPSATTKNGWIAGNTYTVNLNKGEIYQVLGVTNNNNGVDLTGSRIRSVAGTAGGCKRIAVFSGAGKIKISNGNCANSSSDNLYQQLYPTGTWGKKYLTVPSFGKPGNFYRIIKNDPTTNVYLNGSLIPAGSFINNTYYELFNNVANVIEADKPISVAQYFTTQECNGNARPYDPDMIVLNPVEQNIDKVTLVSSNLYAPQNQFPHQHHIHVIMRNGGTGISSFTLDGTPVSSSLWVQHPNDPNYSYLYLNNVTQGYHRLASDSGFNAIAYGYGDAESYGYSGGANVKDLYQFVSVQNQYATVNFPATCKGTPFYFSMTFPYQPTQIQWQFSGLFPDVTITNPVYDSTWVVNGRQLYRYKLPNPYSINTPGTYPIKVIASNPTSDGCSGEQEINYDLQVFEPPTADFTFTNTGCVSDPVQFNDNANTAGRPVISYSWNFGDGGTATIRNPSHLYASANSYSVKYSVITDVGCLSDTATKTVVVSQPPVARFGVSAPACVGKTITFTDSSTTATSTIARWYWNFGDGSPQVVATTNAPQTHTYATIGTFNVTLQVETATGCRSTVFSAPVVIKPNPLASFNFGNACLPAATMQFTNTSSISDGTQSQFTYQWSFGDGNNSTVQNPAHNYSAAGPFNVTLTVTSNAGCTDDTVRVVNTIYARPTASFTVNKLESCINETLNFTDGSTAPNSTVTEWYWNFGDGGTSTAQNPTHSYATPGSYIVTLYIKSAVGCFSDTTTRTIVVVPPPAASFTISNPLCENQSAQFTSTSTPGAGTIVSWSWTVNTAPAGTGNVLNYTPSAPGTYTINLNVTTDKGCTANASQNMLVNTKPKADFSLPNVCLPAGAAQFNNLSTITDGTTLTYVWNFGDGGSSTSTNPTHTYSGAGPFNVSLVATSSTGCVGDTVKALTTIFAQPQAAFNAPTEVCFGATVNFTDGSIAPNSSVTQWLWNFGDGNTSTQQNPTHNYAAPGNYTVTLTTTSAVGCPSTVATRSVVVNPLPAANFTTSVPNCVTRDITFTDASSANAGAIVRWVWDMGDGNTFTKTSNAPFTHNYAATGTYTVTLSVETNKGCISTVFTKPVVVSPLPVPAFGMPENCLG